ncbi:hypothetical protein [Streptomyces cyaneofuscatus]|uniref:hypothetical protein n=1 Tax=Streptomyces cyaneofuscatus TaxID=66883 RepID=UPI0033A41E3D
MDAGLAAVLGALAGAVGAVGGAWMTSRGQWKSARLAARAEHKRQRREPRSEVYATFLNSSNQLLDAWTPIQRISDVTSERRTLVYEAADSIDDAYSAVALSGPEEVSNIAEQIRDHAAQLKQEARFLWAGQYVMQDNGEPEAWIFDIESRIPRARTALSAQIRKFTVSARTTLDDDGSTL